MFLVQFNKIKGFRKNIKSFGNIAQKDIEKSKKKNAWKQKMELKNKWKGNEMSFGKKYRPRIRIGWICN